MKRLLTTQMVPIFSNYMRGFVAKESCHERNGKLDLLLHQSSYEARARQLIDEFKADLNIIAVRQGTKNRS